MRPDRMRTALALALLALCACSEPEPPEKERPPEPQAAPAPLGEAMERPIERAKAVEAELQRAADAQRAAIDAASGG